MKEVECIVLEDNKEYGILERIKEKDIEYIYLFNIEDPKIFYIRKTDGEILYGLDNDEEYNYALSLVRDKYKDLIDNLDIK